VFFGPQGDTRWNQKRLQEQLGVNVQHTELNPTAIVHTAAQPSPNAVGTLNLLEATRQSCPESPFVHLSTNKVYGDRPNSISLEELDTRWDYDDPACSNGISESFPIDQSKRSLSGALKVAADVLVQDYGRWARAPSQQTQRPTARSLPSLRQTAIELNSA
jgi:CDP-paratose 2-epimerase